MTNLLGLAATLLGQAFTLFLMWFLGGESIGKILELSLIGNLITIILYFGSDQALSVAYVNSLNRIGDDSPDLRECGQHLLLLGLLNFCACLVPLYLLHGFESSLFLITSVSVNFYCLKGLEIYLRSNSRLKEFFLISIAQVFTINFLFLAFFSLFKINDVESMTFSRVLATILLSIFVPWKIVCKGLSSFRINPSVIKYFSNFSLNGVVSYVLSQVDRYAASWHFDGGAYAALSLMSNVANLVSLPKIVTSNQWLRSISDEKAFLGKVRKTSFIYSLCFGFIILGLFFLLKNIVLADYIFNDFVWVLLLGACFFEIIVGPIGMVLQYNHSVKYVVLSDSITVAILASVFLITKDMSATAVTFGMFYFLSRAVMVLNRFFTWKYIKNV
jgi:hypothetical protein